MTVRDLIKDLENYHDPNAEVIALGGLDVEGIGISDFPHKAKLRIYGGSDGSELLEDLESVCCSLEWTISDLERVESYMKEGNSEALEDLSNAISDLDCILDRIDDLKNYF